MARRKYEVAVTCRGEFRGAGGLTSYHLEPGRVVVPGDLPPQVFDRLFARGAIQIATKKPEIEKETE